MDVGNRLAAGSRGVDVGAEVWAEDAEGGGGEAFRGDVDVFTRQGGGTRKKDGLFHDVFLVLGFEGWVEFDHFGRRGER